MLFNHSIIRLTIALFATLALSIATAMAAPAGRRDAVVLVEGGKARAAVVVPATADDQTKAAAELLIRYVEKATGAKLPLHAEGAKETAALPARVFVGPCQAVTQAKLLPEGMDGDGFVIAPVGRDALAIVGPTPWGTEFGVCEFLERYAGVRWLMPGPDGEDVPRAKDLVAARETIRQEPAFFSRLFSGLRGPAQVEWARRNRMHGRVSFHHNLIHLFPPEKYTATHPEFFPIRNGKRFLPKDSTVHGWQPCFTAEGIVEEAIRNINAYFDEHPEATSYSLGVNDSSGHCECERCQARDPGGNNFLGRRDVSDRYFEWANKVVEGVLKKHPDKFFGCLAYSEVAAPPTRVRVHPRIIPYMTYDRMKWADPEIRAEGEEMTRAWHRASPTVGWYDYLYGTPFCLPRVYFHRMAEYYRFARASGVKVHYAEAYPNWGEGPKLYISLKLQWNPDQDVDQLLREWYDRAVGPAVAPELAAYYAHWEKFWTERALKSRWFSRGGQYLNFTSPLYLADVTASEIAESRRRLEAVVAKAQTPAQKARARLLLQAFEYYEASALAYPKVEAGDAKPPASEAEALAMIAEGERQTKMAEKRIRLAEEWEKDPVLAHPLSPARFPLLSGRDWGGTALWRAFDWLARGSKPVRERLEQLAAAPEASLAGDQARMMLALASPDKKPISANSSFEEGDRNAPPWNFWIKTAGTMRRVEGTAHTGKASVLCKGVDRGGPNMQIPVTPGRYGAVAFAYTPPGSQTKGTVELAVTFRDAKGQNIPGSPSTMATLKPGEWTVLAVPAQIPAKVGNREVKSVLLVPIVNGFAEGEEVYLDDVALYRLD
jgi:hypothetical protein